MCIRDRVRNYLEFLGRSAEEIGDLSNDVVLQEHLANMGQALATTPELFSAMPGNVQTILEWQDVYKRQVQAKTPTTQSWISRFSFSFDASAIFNNPVASGRDVEIESFLFENMYDPSQEVLTKGGRPGRLLRRLGGGGSG